MRDLFGPLTACILPGTIVFSLADAWLVSVLTQGGDLDIGSVLTVEVVGALSVVTMLIKARFA